MDEFSLLFAVEAEQLIISGFFDEAIELCRQGIEHFPEYPIAYSLLSQALEKDGKIEDATEIISFALLKLGESKTLQINYKNLTGKEFVFPIEDYINYQENDISENISNVVEQFDEQTEKPNNIIFLKAIQKRNDELNESHLIKANNLNLIPGLDFSPLKTFEKKKIDYSGIIDNNPINFDDININQSYQQIDLKSEKINLTPNSIDEMISKFENFKINQPLSNTIIEQPVVDDNLPVASETLAKILTSQKAYKEAINIYELLIEENPDKMDEYMNKIIELEEKI